MLPEYELQEPLAVTSRHALYRATRISTGQAVVLKRARHDYPLRAHVLRLEFEAHVLDKLRGPGVIDLLGVERVAGSPVLVLEDFGGQSLDELSVPPLSSFFFLAERIVEALSRIHAADVIHKDIKPSNILWNRDNGAVKLIDFRVPSAPVHDERSRSGLSWPA